MWRVVKDSSTKTGDICRWWLPWWGCTKKVDNGFDLKGEPRLKSYVDVVVGTPRKVALDDRDRFGLDGEIFGVTTKLSMCDDGDSLTQNEAHHVESNTKGAIKRQLNI